MAYIIMSSTFLDDLKMQHLGHGFAPSLLLGFFYQDNTQASHLWQRYMEKCYSLEPSFMPTSLLLQSTGQKEGRNAVRPLSLDTFIEGFVASLNFYEPIVSQDSFLVLCHRSRDVAILNVVRVCNPPTGEVFHIPDLIYRPGTDNYALLVTDDVSLDGQISRSFRLVAIWTTGNRIFYSYYCSKTRSWWKPSTSPEIMPGLFCSVFLSFCWAWLHPLALRELEKLDGHSCRHTACGRRRTITPGAPI
ncbi:hypothetical protein GQ55_9G031700 [Panicum hallii var. hallii]|uniref:Uncharacterized protein n=1 Tax=Panicum hallii var. hallii TaxID=1504633 RepID=A0A2T7BZ70_9POAL|nr:hypothetical protein GQ55_9G031700 [Panicum hallii var. hallii]